MSKEKYELSATDHDAESGEVEGRQDPPGYQATQGNGSPPPSYNSLFGELKAAKEDAGGANMDFAKKIVAILMGSLATTIILALFLAFPIAMIVIGALKLDDCRAEPYIPKWLLIMGCFGLLKNLLSLGQQVFNKARDNKEKNASKNPIECILDLFLFAWFIAGSVWVFRTYGDVSYTESSEHYCDRLLFLFSFWTLMSTYILMALSCCCCICVCIAAIIV